MNRLALWLDNPILVKHVRSRLRRVQMLPSIAVVMVIALSIDGTVLSVTTLLPALRRLRRRWRDAIRRVTLRPTRPTGSAAPWAAAHIVRCSAPHSLQV